MAALFMPGMLELLILGGVIGIPVVIAIVVLVSTLGKNKGPVGSNPNLKPCPDCFNSVSLRAECCPHCGRPLKPEA